jgi:putative YhdH/YhfP family quinone oxidoreductase
MTAFHAFVVHKTEDKQFRHSVDQRDTDELPAGEVLVRVHYSSINHKDCLSCAGNPAVTRRFPHTPGVDGAGVVVMSSAARFKEGDQVVLISKGIGENTPGGFGQYVRVSADWVMRLPEGLSLHQSMIYGTAGYTAALCIEALQHDGHRPGGGPIAVSGATGGVASMAIAMLAHQGYQTVAATGKPEAHAFLASIGASHIVPREGVDERSGRNLLVPAWAGAIDTVGGNTLATLIKKCQERGTVAATGNVGSQQLELTVLPFILRGVRLVGVFAQGTDMTTRERVWARMAGEWKPATLDSQATTIGLNELSAMVNHIRAGAQIGRVVVSLL